MARGEDTGPLARFCADLKQLVDDWKAKDHPRRSQKSLAHELEISEGHLSDVLNGRIKRPPNWDKIVSKIIMACTAGDERTVGAWRWRLGVLEGVCEELRQLHRSAGLPQSPGSSPVPARVVRMLRADTVAFTGRKEQIAKIRRALSARQRRQGRVAIHAIDGMPGVGKTTLAVHVGHLLADRFPDGQLFVDLYGHSHDHPVAGASDVLASLLRTLDVPPDRIPEDQDERASRWRDRTAGRRLLLVLDNAAGSEQVIPLLPASADCLVLVTSRSELSRLRRDYGAEMLSLSILPEQEAVALFNRIASGSVDLADEQATLRLVELCGGLPLAITILAAAVNPGTPIADLAEALRVAADRVSEIDSQLGEPEKGVRAAFDLSYRELNSEDRRLLRVLSVIPGTDIDAHAAAALAGLPVAATRRRLTRLRTVRLIESAGRDRYRLHYLIAQYARASTAMEERDPAIERLMGYYQRNAGAADLHLTRYTRPGAAQGADAADVLPRLRSRAEAYGWMTSERDNLLACIGYARTRNDDARVVGLTAALAGYLHNTGPWVQAADLHTAAVAAAAHTRDLAAQAHARHDLGVARYMAEDYDAATIALEEALGIYQDTNQQIGAANALNQLGAVRRVRADLSGAVAAHEQALRIYRDTADRLGEANALNQLGASSYQGNDIDAAATALQQALVIYRQIGDQVGEANTLNYLGAVQDEAGDYRAAIASLEQALDIYRDLKNKIGEANVLNQLGATKHVTGDYGDAIALLRQALVIYREVDNRISEANALERLGAVLSEVGDYSVAIATLQRALDIYRDTENQRGQADVLSDLGIVHVSTGEGQVAGDELTQALKLFTDLDDALGRAQVLNRKGRMHLVNGEPSEAEACHRRALELAASLGNHMEEGRAWEGIGRCTAVHGDASEAATALRRALEIYRGIGSADAERLTVELGDGQQAQ